VETTVCPYGDRSEIRLLLNSAPSRYFSSSVLVLGAAAAGCVAAMPKATTSAQRNAVRAIGSGTDIFKCCAVVMVSVLGGGHSRDVRF